MIGKVWFDGVIIYILNDKIAPYMVDTRHFIKIYRWIISKIVYEIIETEWRH